MSANQQLHTTPTERHRFHLLDGLRGVVAVIVVLWHLPLTPSLHSRMTGYLGVDFFFCLSGFVVAFSYESRLLTGMKFTTFFTTRVIRVYPVYLAGLALGAVSFLPTTHPAQSVALCVRFIGFAALQVVMLPNLRLWPNIALFPLDLPAWSLFLELLANFAYAWILLRRKSTNAIFISACVLSILLLCVPLAMHGDLDIGSGSYRGVVFAIPRVAFSCFVGALLARAYRTLSHPQWSVVTNAVLAAAITAGLVLLLFTPFAWMHSRIVILMTIAIFFPMLVLLGSLIRVPSTWKPVCALLGDISYPVYLLHAPCIALLAVFANIWTSRLSPLSLSLIVLTIAISISLFTLRYLDKPLRSFLTRRYNQTHLASSRTAQAA